MEALVFTPETIDQVITLLRKKTKGRLYWSGIGFGDIKSVEDCPEIDWFRGKGTFERVFAVSFRKLKKLGLIIVYHHKGTCLIPDSKDCLFEFKTEISVVDNDIFIFQEDNVFISKKGGTHIFMEWREERYEKFKKKFV
jgi:hypothetical protein